jgi:hypothetical protein
MEKRIIIFSPIKEEKVNNYELNMFLLPSGIFLLGPWNELTQEIKKPRIFQLLSTGNNQVQMSCSLLPGNPDEVFIPREAIHYTIQSKDIQALYVKSTVGIDLVNTLPKGRLS